MITRWRNGPQEEESHEAIQWFAILWNVETGRTIKQYYLLTPPGDGDMVFSPDSRKIIAKLKFQKTVLLDARTGEVIRRYE